MDEFLTLVQSDILLANRYSVEGRRAAELHDEAKAEYCRDKIDSIFDRLERMYDRWLIDAKDAVRGAGSTLSLPGRADRDAKIPIERDLP